MALFFIFRHAGPCTNMLFVMQILTGVPPLSLATVLKIRLYRRKFCSSFYEMKLIYSRWMIRALIWKCNEVHWKIFLFSFVRKDEINGRIDVSVFASCFSFPAKWTERKMEEMFANLKGITIRGVHRNTDAMCTTDGLWNFKRKFQIGLLQESEYFLCCRHWRCYL
jgi:hypothetical protein